MPIIARCRHGNTGRRAGGRAATAVALIAAAAMFSLGQAGADAATIARPPAHRANHRDGRKTGHPVSRPTVTAHPTWVKYYIVQPPSHGHKQFLYEIAAQTLGNGDLYPEIFNLNKGRVQPDGGRLENPTSIYPGWILVLPPNAHGPGLHYGPLPAVPAPAPQPKPARHDAPAARQRPGNAAVAAVIVATIVLAVLGWIGLIAVGRRGKAVTSGPARQARGWQAGPSADVTMPASAQRQAGPAMEDDEAETAWPGFLIPGGAPSR